ncbi:hypothetical protein, partial [Corynebacterium amycolatum]
PIWLKAWGFPAAAEVTVTVGGSEAPLTPVETLLAPAMTAVSTTQGRRRTGHRPSVTNSERS